MSVKMEILPKSKNALYSERETGITHTPFALELKLFNNIKNGEIELIQDTINEYQSYGFIIGNMSEDNDKTIKYWAISTISTAIHYAILGGLDETDAYNLSDSYIQKIDSYHKFTDVFNYLVKKAIELTTLVKESKAYKKSKEINNAIHYIHIHLHEKITIEDISKHINLSRDYTQALFKKEIGIPIHTYIIDEKIKASLKLIDEGMPFEEIAYTLAFCSQTHFIKAFKKRIGKTPFEYKKSSLQK